MIPMAKCRKTVSIIGFGLRQLKAFSSSPAAIKNDESENKPTFLEEVKESTPHPEKFNKSRLLRQDRNLLNEKLPYSGAHSWIHLSEKYQRKMFARFGSDSGVDPRICFNTKQDLQVKAEYENMAHPNSLADMMAKVRADKAYKSEQIQKREDDIAKKLEKLDMWKSELNSKIAKKEADSLAAKERKERLIEEVRRHFGFKVDPREDRFKEMLEQKEKEDKKKQKEVKRKAKEEKMMAKLVEKTAQPQ